MKCRDCRASNHASTSSDPKLRLGTAAGGGPRSAIKRTAKSEVERGYRFHSLRMNHSARLHGGQSGQIDGMGWFDHDFGSSAFYQVLLWLLWNGQKWLSKWARLWKITDQSQPNISTRPDAPAHICKHKYHVCSTRYVLTDLVPNCFQTPKPHKASRPSLAGFGPEGCQVH